MDGNVGDIEEDEWIIVAVETESLGPRRGYSPVAPTGTVTECPTIGPSDPTRQCVECTRLVGFLEPGASVQCVVRFSMPATVRSGWVVLRLDTGDETAAPFDGGP